MRMDPGQSLTAADIVNDSSEQDLVALLVDNGEGRFARRIVRAIVAARPVATTAQLADIVRTAIPAAARRHGGHPARRVFQAIRIAVNDELERPARGPGRRRRPIDRRRSLRGPVVPLRRGPDRQGPLPDCRHRRLHVPTRTAVRVRGRRRPSVCSTGARASPRPPRWRPTPAPRAPGCGPSSASRSSRRPDERHHGAPALPGAGAGDDRADSEAARPGGRPDPAAVHLRVVKPPG